MTYYKKCKCDVNIIIAFLHKLLQVLKLSEVKYKQYHSYNVQTKSKFP